MRRLKIVPLAGVVAILWVLVGNRGATQSQIHATTVAAAADASAVRAWDNTVNRMLRTRELQVRLSRPDTLVAGRTMEQLDQYYQGVRVWGGSLSRQLAGDAAISVFGVIYSDISVGVVPTLSREDAKAAVERIGGETLGPDRLPELVVLPLDGTYRLVWVGEIATVADTLRLFLDAHSGAELQRHSIRQRDELPGAVGTGTGVLGDTKKITTTLFGGAFYTVDGLRPPTLNTYDLRGNLAHVIAFLNGLVSLTTADVATDTDNNWTDQAVVDAHVYSGYTYDYYYKRFGRQGLDNNNIRILNLVHPVNRADIDVYPESVVSQFYVNAFYAGSGIMVYGEGLPTGFYLVENGHFYNYFSGAIDIVGHELTHGVTVYTSNLEYKNESGALNEAFSDIMGTSIEFFFQPPGDGPEKADYLLGEDISTAAFPGGHNGDRSLADPASGSPPQPDHYSKFVVLPATPDGDNGGVHINSGIPNQAFYLAIEGGTNRTSGIRVSGVGASNREQIEKVFYRAFAQLMPSNANFSLARAITLQAATDLYGAGSAPYTAVRDAWTAVGVN